MGWICPIRQILHDLSPRQVAKELDDLDHDVIRGVEQLLLRETSGTQTGARFIRCRTGGLSLGLIGEGCNKRRMPLSDQPHCNKCTLCPKPPTPHPTSPANREASK